MELDKKSIKILKCLMNENDILVLNQLMVLTHYPIEDILDRLVYMREQGYIRVVDYEQPELLPMDGKFQITVTGKIFLENRAKRLVLTWSPIVLSVTAIIISIIALFK